jgi:hypothetical protein
MEAGSAERGRLRWQLEECPYRIIASAGVFEVLSQMAMRAIRRIEDLALGIWVAAFFRHSSRYAQEGLALARRIVGPSCAEKLWPVLAAHDRWGLGLWQLLRDRDARATWWRSSQAAQLPPPYSTLLRPYCSWPWYQRLTRKWGLSTLVASGSAIIGYAVCSLLPETRTADPDWSWQGYASSLTARWSEQLGDLLDAHRSAEAQAEVGPTGVGLAVMALRRAAHALRHAAASARQILNRTALYADEKLLAPQIEQMLFLAADLLFMVSAQLAVVAVLEWRAEADVSRGVPEAPFEPTVVERLSRWALPRSLGSRRWVSQTPSIGRWVAPRWQPSSLERVFDPRRPLAPELGERLRKLDSLLQGLVEVHGASRVVAADLSRQAVVELRQLFEQCYALADATLFLQARLRKKTGRPTTETEPARPMRAAEAVQLLWGQGQPQDMVKVTQAAERLLSLQPACDEELRELWKLVEGSHGHGNLRWGAWVSFVRLVQASEQAGRL